jgi:hypothetical protein
MDDKQRARRDEAKAVTMAAIEAGKCPTCGAGICHQTQINDWWMCEQYGGEQFRKDPDKPRCSWQGFTN